ncbi:hypothetical protein ambt_12820 [Alteromonas naphthalenivorans]|jgi:hypothetical protein|uniref:Nucleotidyl transferase AbiEii/AbiGii toxin family protein n=2 Tax=Alteromonas TaxID=226 RepID=F5ZDX2_ALTNA|nr:nucleotidyl transferase AbiEii/AbiGii toxin family protein [Alteromonas naphthalenivorans]AEF04084.1 hypothetical protein ambt_12820 [Alteromonas naphthalenivorans]|tara:strand:- start:228 stop:656 length:429 start_codon:yes stop_codon:yes gene_type:complete
MDRNSIYYKQVQLLMQVLPFVAKQECFALKGGTAINLFVREFPRLSVDLYAGEFANMSETDVPLKELVAVRERLVALIHQGLTNSEKGFLLSFKNREPNWGLLNLDDVSELPAIKWKQINLAQMPDEKHKLALDKLKEVLSV